MLVFAAPASAAAGSPVFRAMTPGVADSFENSSRIFVVDNAAFSPSSQVIFNLSRPTFAAQNFSATTVTPDGTCSTARTPGILNASAASTLTTFPPNTGGLATTAYTIPGNRTSNPNCAVPFTLEGVSSRRTGFPMSVNCFGSFSGTFAGGFNCAAASASDPYVAFLPDSAWITTPFSTRQLDAATPHFCAAASTSMTRAIAPMRRKRSHSEGVVVLPPVICRPNTVWL